MARNTHDRQLDHHSTDLDTNIEVSGDVGTTLSGDTVHVALQDIWTAMSAVQGYHKNGTIDPAAVGLDSPIGSIYSRDNSGAGELWLKTGAATTAWTKVSVPLSVNLPLLSQTAVASAPVVSSTYGISLGLISQTALTFTPTVSSTYGISLGLINQTAATFAPTIS
jgi:hypothetical protein